MKRYAVGLKKLALGEGGQLDHNLPQAAVEDNQTLLCKPTSKGSQTVLSLWHAPGFTLGFEESEDVVLLDGALDVSDDRSGGVVHEFNANLSNTTTGAGAAQHACERKPSAPNFAASQSTFAPLASGGLGYERVTLASLTWAVLVGS